MSDHTDEAEATNAAAKNTLSETLGIKFVTITKDYLKATMPVDKHNIQPFGILHGGASVALAETLGSVGGMANVDPKKQHCVGLEINANHIRSVFAPNEVTGVATPLHRGKKTQIWQIKITNKDEQLVCISRITLAVLDRK